MALMSFSLKVLLKYFVFQYKSIYLSLSLFLSIYSLVVSFTRTLIQFIQFLFQLHNPTSHNHITLLPFIKLFIGSAVSKLMIILLE
jgi:hypothetical protein